MFRGLIPIMYHISEREIQHNIDLYRGLHPEDKRTDEDLRAYAINTELYKRPGASKDIEIHRI